MRAFTFNRRRVVDQLIYIEASNYAEALARARRGHLAATGDETTASMTIRPVTEGSHP